MNLESTFDKKVSRPEEYRVTSEYGSIVGHENIAYAITSDGEQGVPIPDDVAEHIALMLRLQHKVHIEGDQDASHVMQTFNCRKSVLIASGAIPIMQSIVDLSDNSGEQEMFDDVNRLLSENHNNVAELRDYASFEDVIDGYEGSFPCIVHVFESETPVTIDSFSEIAPKLHRVHSFLVLGQDDTGYVCFQKVGPSVDEPFTITDLSFVTHLYRNKENRFGYFVYGPYKS